MRRSHWTAVAIALLLLAGNAGAAEAVAQPRNAGPGFWEYVHNFFLPHPEQRKILLERQTLYFLVTVEEGENGWRHLVFNPGRGSQGMWNPAAPGELLSNYCKYAALFLQGIDQYPRRVLFIGLGAGIMPRFIQRHFPSATIDIVELDAAIPDIAKEYFAFREDEKTRVIIGDGRDFINRNQLRYDLIFIDAYNAESIPFQLTTVEFYRKVRAALTPGGMMSANLANLGNPEFIASELKTVLEVFPHLAVFVCPGRSNYILLAPADRALNSAAVKPKCVELAQHSHPELNFKAMLETRMGEAAFRQMTGGAIILRDDFAPVETMSRPRRMKQIN